jgi:hypothetical protein
LRGLLVRDVAHDLAHLERNHGNNRLRARDESRRNSVVLKARRLGLPIAGRVCWWHTTVDELSLTKRWCFACTEGAAPLALTETEEEATTAHYPPATESASPRDCDLPRMPR